MAAVIPSETTLEFAGLEEWTNECQKARSQCMEDLQRREYESLVRMLPTLSPREREKGLRTAFGLAYSIGRGDEAETLCREFLREYPNSPEAGEAWQALAHLLDENGAAFRDVSNAYQKAIATIGTSDRRTWVGAVLNYADFMAKEGEVMEARKLLQDAGRLIAHDTSLSRTKIKEHIDGKIRQFSLRGLPVPAFKTKDIEGRMQSPAAYKGKVLLLDFWATWCGPCVKELPSLQKIHEQHARQGLQIIGISLDRDEQALRSFIRERDVAWPVILDVRGHEVDELDTGLAKQFDVKAIPMTVLVDKKGVVAAVNLRGEELARAVEMLVQGKKVSAGRPRKPAQKDADKSVRREDRRPVTKGGWDPDKVEHSKLQIERMLDALSIFANGNRRFPADPDEWRARCGPVPVSPWETPYQYSKTPDDVSFTIHVRDADGRLAIDYIRPGRGSTRTPGIHVHVPPKRWIATLADNMIWNEPAPSNPLGNILADSVREMTGADVAFIHSRAIAGNLAAGPVTAEDLARVAPSADGYVLVEITGGDLIDVLPKSVAPGWGLFTSGLRGEFWYGERGFAGNFYVSDTPVSAERTYRAVVSRYLFEGGDQYPTLNGRKVIQKLPAADADILRRYLSKRKNVTVDRHPRIQGRPRDLLLPNERSAGNAVTKP